MIYNPEAAVKEALVPIEEGGTYASSVTEAVKNLGAVTRNMVGRPGGIATTNENNELPSNFIPESLANVTKISLFGPTTIDSGSENNRFDITNYDSSIPYVITSTLGTFTRDSDQIFFTSNGVAGIGSLKINGVTFSFYVVQEVVVTPQILFPVNGSSPGYQSRLLVSTASFNSNRPMSNHLSTDWEISTNATFTGIVASSYSNVESLVSWAATGLLPSITYYARARHRADTMRVSAWSTPVSFTMSVNETDYTVPGTYTFTMAENGTATILAQGSGGGGGGGWDSVFHSSGLGGGGGSSGESKTIAMALLKNDVIKIVIPAGGLNGLPGGGSLMDPVPGREGGNGSPAKIYVNDVLKLTALGGLGGKTRTTGTGDNEWAYGGAAVGNGTAGGSTRSQVGAAGGNSPTGGIGGAANNVRHTAGNPGTKGGGGGGAGPVTSVSASLPGGGVGGAGYAKLTIAYDQVVGTTVQNEYSVVGTYSYTVGAGVDTAITYVQGGGGGGGSGYTPGGGGGGAGEYKKYSFPVVEGDVITVTVGPGGIRGTTRVESEQIQFTSATPGSVTTVKKNGVVVVTANGGAAGITEGGSTYSAFFGGGGTNGANSEYAPGTGGTGGGGQNFTMAGNGTKGGGGGGGSQGSSGDNYIGSVTGLAGGNGGDGVVRLFVGKATTASYGGQGGGTQNVTRTYSVTSNGIAIITGKAGAATDYALVIKSVSPGDVISASIGHAGSSPTSSIDPETGQEVISGSYILGGNTTVSLNGVTIISVGAPSGLAGYQPYPGSFSVKFIPVS